MSMPSTIVAEGDYTGETETKTYRQAISDALREESAA